MTFSERRIYAFWALIFLVFVLSSASQAQSPDREALIKDLKGTVSVRLQGSAWQPAQENMTLHVQDEIKTGKDSTAVILIDPQGKPSELKLRPESLLKFDQMNLGKTPDEKHTLLNLAIGKVLIHAAKLQGDSTFEVKTPTSTTGVRGTIFEVSVEEESKSL